MVWIIPRVVVSDFHVTRAIEVVQRSTVVKSYEEVVGEFSKVRLIAGFACRAVD